MSSEQRPILSRRAVLAGAAATCASLAASTRQASAEEVGPIFSSTGPNAELYGAATGYPVPDAIRADGRAIRGSPVIASARSPTSTISIRPGK